MLIVKLWFLDGDDDVKFFHVVLIIKSGFLDSDDDMERFCYRNFLIKSFAKIKSFVKLWLQDDDDDKKISHSHDNEIMMIVMMKHKFTMFESSSS